MIKRLYGNLQQAIERSEEPCLYFRKKYVWLIILSVVWLVLIGFAWIQYNTVVSNNLWYSELQETKKQNVLLEREVGATMWGYIEQDRIEKRLR